MAFNEKHPRHDVILHDATGEEKLGQKVMDSSIPVTMASNQPAIPVSVGAAASEGADTEYLTDDGLVTGAHDMVVNGSGTPVSFTFPAHATRDIVLTGVRLVFSAAFFAFDGNSDISKLCTVKGYRFFNLFMFCNRHHIQKKFGFKNRQMLVKNTVF